MLEAAPSEPTTTITLSPLDAAELEEETSVALPELAEGAGMLVVKRGPNAGSRFVLEEDVVGAGRHPDSHIFLDDITVSRRHAEFERQGGGYVVRDVGSLNGTYLNRERIETSPLVNGDEVQIGKFKLIFLARADG
ncbi:MAG: FHA-domain-containing protein [uncultured Acidimicrobiales bacterium]|uniref:FHA-domain-containing protein n=1 Tax=uncultured Acidimicrobiales bacterium TaxID=310071 RepID=A0A6J4IBT1_9ACTN|nr:MAG: FHA-domain-containing protein [uncultured Acidimicrobiales bacterium]